MRDAEFDAMVEETTGARLAMAMAKGREYANENEDRFFNFRLIGELFGLEPETVAMVYLMKHMLSLCTYIKDLERENTRTLVEPVQGRIDDAQNYLDLLRGIILERDKGGVT